MRKRPLNLEREKLWRLTKSSNEDTTLSQRNTIIIKAGTIHSGTQAANILRGAFRSECSLQIPSERNKKIKDSLQEKIRNQNPNLSVISNFGMSELTDAIRKPKRKNAPGKDEQTACTKNRNTEDQLIVLTQSIENSFQEKTKVIAVFMDLSMAFDKVWKDSLMLKLLNAGIAGKMYSWIKSYLQHRTAKVKLV
ncbi:uncharacterized protein LOC121374747 [Gigantopelta aegis]|uniref:uncharacterized protein LOC121374747 n=1 Tax=Gigantopelta aegis TaxID=1735272 RepID=UPI001B88E69F|nr:uncharacterized protein LOC121374747 [Gigantopelta aegis]